MAVLVSIFLTLAFLFLRADVPMTSGEAYVEVLSPFGRGLRLPYRYGYFLLKIWPVLMIAFLVIAAAGPVLYVIMNRRESS